MANISTVPARKNVHCLITLGGTTVMSTLAVVEEILRETSVPMSVREIVERAGVRLPSKSKTPDTVVARDLSMDIKKKGEGSLFVRTSPGRYTLRVLAAQTQPVADISALRGVAPQPMSALAARKPAVAAAASPVRPAGRDSAEGGGYAG
jgi:hypothetical protein